MVENLIASFLNKRYEFSYYSYVNSDFVLHVCLSHL